MDWRPFWICGLELELNYLDSDSRLMDSDLTVLAASSFPKSTFWSLTVFRRILHSSYKAGDSHPIWCNRLIWAHYYTTVTLQHELPQLEWLLIRAVINVLSIGMLSTFEETRLRFTALGRGRRTCYKSDPHSNVLVANGVCKVSCEFKSRVRRKS